MQRCLASVLLVLLVAGLVGCDHATKHIAQSELRGNPPVTLLGNILDLRYTENRDVGFGLLRAVPAPVRRPLILVGGSVGLGFLGLLWWRRRRASLLEHAAYATFVGGALGNLTDRLARGYVIDFVHLHHWPVFNVADVCLVAGAVLIWLASRTPSRTEDAPRLAPVPVKAADPRVSA
jgi:signal peptidase II